MYFGSLIISTTLLWTIWDVALGSQLDSVRQDLGLLEADYRVDVPNSTSEAIIFRKPDFTVAVWSMKIITHTLDKAAVSPLPRQTHWLMRLLSTYRRARAEKQKLIQNRFDDTKSRLLSTISDSTVGFAGITCATDHMVRQEAQAAAKEGREPTFASKQAKDELFGFLVGGYTIKSYHSHVDDEVDGGQSGTYKQNCVAY